MDSAAHRRAEPGVLEDAWRREGTRVVLVHEGRLAVAEDEDGVRLDLRAPAALDTAPPLADAVRVFLGEDADGAYLAALLAGPDDVAGPEGVAAPPVPETSWASLRDVGHLLDDRDADLATTAVALAEWHRRTLRCRRCGSPTEPAEAGWTRRCPVDGVSEYPRTDPAVIVAVTDDAGRILLAHATHWPPRRFSTLAGFVEPGESAESAVRREVLEEVGLAVDRLTYAGSQPWPFPASLMLAFRARAAATDLTVDGVELSDARWFTRRALQEAVREGEILLPMRTSVARALIEEWYGGRLEDPPA